MTYSTTWESVDEAYIDSRIAEGDRLRAWIRKLADLKPSTLGLYPETSKAHSSETSLHELDYGRVVDYQQLMIVKDQKEQIDKFYPNVCKKLETFRDLERGWDSYEGIPPSDDTVDYGFVVLAHLRELVQERGKRLPEPSVFAGGEGAIQFEWKRDGISLELEFLADSASGLFRISYLICPSENMEDWLEEEFSGEPSSWSPPKALVDWI